MSKKRLTFIAIAVLVLGLFAAAFYMNTNREPEYTGPHAELNERADAVEAYVRTNLSTLSPEKEVLGGTFYVTRIRLMENTGTVEYEDGHNAYVADFSYSISDDLKRVSVSEFTVRPPAPAPEKTAE